MGKRQYLGGGTLVGCGSISKAKNGGRGGLGSGAALREQRHQAECTKRRAIAARIRGNEKLLKKVSKELIAAKGVAHYERIVVEHRTKVSPLAQALQEALDAVPKSR